MSWAQAGRAVAGLISGPAGVVATVAGELVADFVEQRRQARADKATAAERRRQDRGAWELKALEGGSIWMRRATLGLFCWPLVWAHVDPGAMRAYFDTLEQMPEWYLLTLGGMLATVWGVQGLRTLRAGRRRP